MGYWYNIRESLASSSELRVFVSHKREDEAIAVMVANRLAAQRVAPYLDTLDPVIVAKTGDELVEHLRAAMSLCTHLMAVVSENTKKSWWVPWEIGVATEKDFPLSTYAGGDCELPDYLRKWPYLRRVADIDAWVEASRKANANVASQRYLKEQASVVQGRAAKEFYKEVRRALRQ